MVTIVQTHRQEGHVVGMFDSHDDLYYFALGNSELWVANQLGQQWYSAELPNRHKLSVNMVITTCLKNKPIRQTTAAPWGNIAPIEPVKENKYQAKASCENIW